MSASYPLRRPNDWTTCLCFLSKQETQRINVNKARDEKKGKEPRTSGGAVNPGTDLPCGNESEAAGPAGSGPVCKPFQSQHISERPGGVGPVTATPPPPTSPEAQARAEPKSALLPGQRPRPQPPRAVRGPRGWVLAGSGQSLRLWAHVGRLPRCWGLSSQPSPSWTTALRRASVSSSVKWANSPNLAGKE